MTLINSDFERTRWMEARNTGAAIPAFSFVRVKEAITVTDATTGNGRLVLDLAIAGDDETAVTTEAANVFGFVGSMAIPVGTTANPAYGLITLDSIAWALYDSGTGSPEPGQVWWPSADNSGDLEYAGAGGNAGAEETPASHNWRDAQFTVLGGVNSSETRMMVSRGGMDSFAYAHVGLAGGAYTTTGTKTLAWQFSGPADEHLLNGITEDSDFSNAHWDYDTGTDTATCLYAGWWEYHGFLTATFDSGAAPTVTMAAPPTVVSVVGGDYVEATIGGVPVNAESVGRNKAGTMYLSMLGAKVVANTGFQGYFLAKSAATATTFTVDLVITAISGGSLQVSGSLAMRRLNV
jgi:hypothetical protein